jgi:hypothetical protein
LASPRNQQTFLEDLGFSFPVQGNDPGCSDRGCNISSICADFMTNEALGDPVDRLAALSALQLGREERPARDRVTGEPCLEASYEAVVLAPLRNTTLAGGGDRVWTWQTCTEYGFYQTCEPGSGCPFAQDVVGPAANSLQSYLDQCDAAFGTAAGTFAEADVAASVAFSNLWSGGWNPASSRVLYVNGEIDPWHSQSVLPGNREFGKVLPVGPAGSGLAALMVEGSSHHYWTHATGVQSPPIVQARELIFAQVKAWLAEDADGATAAQ